MDVSTAITGNYKRRTLIIIYGGEWELSKKSAVGLLRTVFL